MYLLGTSLYNLGKFAEAIEVFKDIAKNYSHDAELVQKAEYEIADCFYQMGNEKEAMERFKVLRSRYPDSSLTPEVMWWLGEYYYRHNDLVLARRYFSSLIQDFPKSSLIADAYYALATICEEESKYEEAISNFKQVMELGKSDLAGTSAIAIADINVKQGQFDAALNLYNEVIKNHSNLEHLIYPKIAEVYRNMNKYEEALEFYRKSLTAVPARQMAQIQFKIAETKEAQGKKEEAIEEYLKVTYLYSENNQLIVKSLLRIAAIYEDREDFKEARSVYKKIISMNVEEAKYAQERIDWIETHAK
jgi:TolA-binding protein